jgi:hypothetical protein
METREKIEFANLPLGVYKEVEAHLLQLSGLEVGLIPQSSSEFDYDQSQVSGLWIEWKANADADSREKVKQIVSYYQDRYRI